MTRNTRLQKYMDILREQLPTLAEQYHVAALEVFGSYVRHEERKNSDFDYCQKKRAKCAIRSAPGLAETPFLPAFIPLSA